MNNEWYFLEYEEKTYLHNKVLCFKAFPGLEGEHAHCELCWARFSKHPHDLRNGYFEQLSNCWICSNCYDELATLFGWTVG